jgi:NAD(P)-dependent dehydrogenase (short-subunit alcohol dehydrogenase family)
MTGVLQVDEDQDVAMTGRLDGKVALITGGASGMGFATAQRFLAEGARVLIADYNAETGAKALADLGDGDRVRFERVDVSVEDDVERAVGAAVGAFGQLDVLFNNAGVGGAFGAVTDLHVEDWDYTFAVLVRGVFLGIKHGARQMVAQGWGGAILNTASIAGMSGGGGPLCYSSAKAAVINLTSSAAVELAPHRIRVNAINPGTILTPLMHGGRPEKVGARLERYVPWPDTVGRPEDIAGAALYLASDDAAYVTGTALVVDGGLTAAGPGLIRGGGPGSAPPGYVGANRGTTGEETVVRQRPPR